MGVCNLPRVLLEYFVQEETYDQYAFVVFDRDMRGAGVRVYAGDRFYALNEEGMRMNTIPILFEGHNMAGHYMPLFPPSGRISDRPTLDEIVDVAIAGGITIQYNGHVQIREGDSDGEEKES